MTDTTTTDLMLNQYEPFYLMTRSAAMLGTKSSDAFNRDAAAIIDFIGKAYCLSQETIDDAAKVILGEMMRVGLASDYLALASSEMLDSETRKNMILFEIKGRAIADVNRSEIIGSGFGSRAEHEIRNNMGYCSFHHEYDPRLRFAQVKKIADNGDVTAMLEEAFLLILGIGCQSDMVFAQRLLQNLLVWGEKAAAVILSFLWEREGDSEMHDFYDNVVDTMSSNRLFLDMQNHSETQDLAEQFCILISAVQSVIIRGCGRKEVDMIFADLISRDDVPFEKKLEWIRKYQEGNWLNQWTERKTRQAIGFARPDKEEGGRS